MEKIVKEIEFELRGQVVKGKFPTIGQQISVETTKQVLSEGRYALMAYSGLATSAEVLDYIDAIAYMKIDGAKRYLVFVQDDNNATSGSRCKHLAGKEILISERLEDGTIKTYWENIYPETLGGK